MFGMGLQIFVNVFFSLIFFTMGVIVPTARFFALYNGIIYMIMGSIVNGYCTARLMKYFGATEWIFAASVSAFCFPIYVSSTFLLVDLIEYFEKAN
jgi:Endomembrane protein 70